MVLRFLFTSANCRVSCYMRRCRFSKHFQRTVKETDASKLFDSMKGEFHESITQREMESIQNNLHQLDKKKKRRFVYRENYKQDVAKYAAQCGTTAAIRKFKHIFPNLNESTVRPWLKKYREN